MVPNLSIIRMLSLEEIQIQMNGNLEFGNLKIGDRLVCRVHFHTLKLKTNDKFHRNSSGETMQNIFKIPNYQLSIINCPLIFINPRHLIDPVNFLDVVDEFFQYRVVAYDHGDLAVEHSGFAAK